jgi:hypothetical protein
MRYGNLVDAYLDLKSRANLLQIGVDQFVQAYSNDGTVITVDGFDRVGSYRQRGTGGSPVPCVEIHRDIEMPTRQQLWEMVDNALGKEFHFGKNGRIERIEVRNRRILPGKKVHYRVVAKATKLPNKGYRFLLLSEHGPVAVDMLKKNVAASCWKD